MSAKNLPSALAALDATLMDVRAEKRRAEGLIREAKVVLGGVDERLNRAMVQMADVAEAAQGVANVPEWVRTLRRSRHDR